MQIIWGDSGTSHFNNSVKRLKKDDKVKIYSGIEMIEGIEVSLKSGETQYIKVTHAQK